jgi:spermidine synthase
VAARPGDVEPPLRLLAAAVAGALAGGGCMAAELSAVRLLAPHFGDSAYVWTNVIGVILAALATGACLGARWSRRASLRGPAMTACVAAGVWLAASPWVARGVGTWLVPADLPLDAAMPALISGSFVATALLFAPAMVALGAVSPLLVTLVVRSGSDVGRAAGVLSAAGTLGSLGGTFAATHWLVPTFGCRMAMAIAGGALLAAGMLVGPRRRAIAGGVGLLAITGSLLAARGPLRPIDSPLELLEEVESRVQFLQVVRDPTAAPPNVLLRINEGLDSFHSVAIAGSTFTGERYYDWHGIAPLLVTPAVAPGDLRVLSIGDAAGSLRTVYAGVHAGAVVDAVDIDAATMALGDRWFPGPKADGARYVVDGRVFLDHATGRWHVIHVDAYAHQVYVPAHLASREFFAALRERLHDGGVVACNVGALHVGDPVLQAIGATVAAVFGHALAFQIPRSRNALLVAAKGAPPRPAAIVQLVPAGLSASDRELWERVLARAAAGPWIDLASAAPVLRDDRPELDRLFASSYIERTDPATTVSMNGPEAAAGAESAAYAAAMRSDWTGVLAAVQQSREATPTLREYAGDARWSLRLLHGAAAEYRAALGLAADDASRDRLRGKLRDVVSDAEPLVRAERTAARNGAWQWALLGIGAIVAALAFRAR